MSFSDLKGKGGKGKEITLAPAPATAPAEMKSNNNHKDGNANGNNMHVPTNRDEQPQSSLLARVGASAMGLGRNVFSGSGSEREGGEGLRRDMMGLMSGKAGGSGSGSENYVGSSSLRDAGVGFAGPAPRTEGMRSLGNSNLEGYGGDGKASESLGERVRHMQQSENEFSDFLDRVPSLTPADDFGFASGSGSGSGAASGVENRSHSRSRVDYATSSSSGSGAGAAFGADFLSQGNSNMFTEDADAEVEGRGEGMNSDMGRFHPKYGAVSSSNPDLIQESTNSDWGNVWARTSGASTSTERVQNPQVKIDKLGDFDMKKFLSESVASSKISSTGENGKVSSSGYSEKDGSKSVGYNHTDISEQEKRDGEEVREILSKIGGANLNFEEEMEELLTEQKEWATNEQEMKGYEWEWKWGMSEEERERIRKITRDLLFLEPVVRGIPKGVHSLDLVPGYEREREERWREEERSKGEEDAKGDVFAGVVFKDKMDDGKGKCKEEWKSDWKGVLRGYTDEVWGGLLPLVIEAREELQREEKEGKTGEGKDTGDLKALRRLGAVLGHLKGIGREV
ncbi:predicted protein [Sclerotinia sclerotiorum 1980 UF-70]|uniref:Uncharacterized protein n=2 Tax=Sclerotinia sclerotiorum (strain ATCC 18683 / 1980 / Ss-1) TaxID=665079 RepID=A7ERB1_SCLS1|nr:predicted protein [Sclerotinia sclerotiorum 1980 UF-70]APA13505.1 hypothetical protein sscle_11g082750 [Sclerotinia sclerotiorum 1980 UF-70]EDN92003.1 predicted protein [Sclerotinia sclerotiorum 1980 UF-70]